MELKHYKESSWVIAHINKEHVWRSERDMINLRKRKDLGMEFPNQLIEFIPTVRILRKTFKGKDIFEHVPFLFNYGFFQIPKKHIDHDFLNKIRTHVPCVHSWLRGDVHESNSFALATKKEIEHLNKVYARHSIYDKWDIDNLKPDTIINLRGYPFDGMDARVITVDRKKEKVKVELLMGGGGLMKTQEVSFDNIIFTMYHGVWDEQDFKEESLEEMQFRKKGSYQKYMKNDE